MSEMLSPIAQAAPAGGADIAGAQAAQAGATSGEFAALLGKMTGGGASALPGPGILGGNPAAKHPQEGNGAASPPLKLAALSALTAGAAAVGEGQAEGEAPSSGEPEAIAPVVASINLLSPPTEATPNTAQDAGTASPLMEGTAAPATLLGVKQGGISQKPVAERLSGAAGIAASDGKPSREAAVKSPLHNKDATADPERPGQPALASLLGGKGGQADVRPHQASGEAPAPRPSGEGAEGAVLQAVKEAASGQAQDSQGQEATGEDFLIALKAGKDLVHKTFADEKPQLAAREGAHGDLAALAPPLRTALQAQQAAAVQNAASPSRTVFIGEHKFVITRQSDSLIEVSLKPDGLGRLEVHVSLERGVLHAHIQAADPAGKEIIERNLQGILDELSKDGLQVGDFSVALRDGRGGEGFAEGSGSHEHETGITDTNIDGTGARERGPYRGLLSVYA